jgi:hypothetical protein
MENSPMQTDNWVVTVEYPGPPDETRDRQADRAGIAAGLFEYDASWFDFKSNTRDLWFSALDQDTADANRITVGGSACVPNRRSRVKRTPLKRGKSPKRGSKPLQNRKPLRVKPPTPEQKAAKQKRQRKRAAELYAQDCGRHADFVRSFPCCACGVYGKTTSHHEPPRSKKGGVPMIQRQTPLCPECHQDGGRARHKIGRTRFEEVHGTDLVAIAADLWAASPFNPENAT